MTSPPAPLTDACSVRRRDAEGGAVDVPTTQCNLWTGFESIAIGIARNEPCLGVLYEDPANGSAMRPIARIRRTDHVGRFSSITGAIQKARLLGLL
jgi:hypothetical protein